MKQRISAVWKESLNLSEVDEARTFIELGGNSLVANRIASKLSYALGKSIPVLKIFEYPTLQQLTRYLLDDSISEKNSDKKISIEMRTENLGAGDRDVAIIGMAGRFPGANHVQDFWKNLIEGKDSISKFSKEQMSSEIPSELKDDPRYVCAAGVLDQPFGMDAAFFGISPSEAKLMDPQQRVLLETAWSALEDAGYSPQHEITERTGIYAGVEDNTYYRTEIQAFPDAEKRAGRFSVMTGNEKDFVALKIAHQLNLKGPAISVHTACSTSLVAVIMACRSLRSGDCDMALAGGASVHFPTPEGYYFQEGGIFSPDGCCRPFDRNAQGTVFTDGSGVVVLKRLSDAIRDKDHIYAVIKGGSINNDGADKASFSAPSVSGQSKCIANALRDSGVDPNTIQYVEAHGTATPVGDPIEVQGLRQAFAPYVSKKQFCGLGSVKSNIGHTTTAAGVISLIKTTLALKNEILPASLYFSEPNPDLDLENSPFYICGTQRPWPRGKEVRRAGVSSFGIGGTNAHVILEEAPVVLKKTMGVAQMGQIRPFEILPVSAKSAQTRDEFMNRFANPNPQEIPDMAFTLQNGRAEFGHRGAWVRFAGNVQKGPFKIQGTALADTSSFRLAFYFGQNFSKDFTLNHLRCLARYIPEFKARLSAWDASIEQGSGIRMTALLANSGVIEPQVAQVVSYIVKSALAGVLIDWGIRPHFLMGQGRGELFAAQLAGVFSLEEGLKILTARSEKDLQNILGKTQFLDPSMSIYSLKNKKILTKSDVMDPEYWFSVLSEDCTIHAERGSLNQIPVDVHAVLNFVSDSNSEDTRETGKQTEWISVLKKIEKPEDLIANLGLSLARLWVAGFRLEWNRIWLGDRRRISLEGYPFERKDYRFSDGRLGGRKKSESVLVVSDAEEEISLDGVGDQELLLRDLGSLFSEYSGLAVEDLRHTFVECGFDSLVLMQIGVEIGKRYGVSVSLRDLMEKYCTLPKISEYIFKNSSPEKLPQKRRLKPKSAGTLAAPSVVSSYLGASVVPPSPPEMMLNANPADMSQLIASQLSQMKQMIETQLRYLH